MNKEESIKKYNSILLQFLNDLVNSIGLDTELRNSFFDEIIRRLKEQFEVSNVNFDENIIKSILSQAFNQYGEILKVYFDSTDIHRISEDTADEQLALEMNAVITSLTNAVNNINQIGDYANLVERMRESFLNYFRDITPNYNDVEQEIKQVLNDVIFKTMYSFTERKKDDFIKYTLPDLYKICDDIGDTVVVQEEEPAAQINEEILAERDKFIYDMMDVEIHESVQNGVLTLSVTDQMGKEKVYYGQEAMDKLTSYNQLFESSRPGKIVDTSHWPTIVNEEPQVLNDNANKSLTSQLKGKFKEKEQDIKDYFSKHSDNVINENAIIEENVDVNKSSEPVNKTEPIAPLVETVFEATPNEVKNDMITDNVITQQKEIVNNNDNSSSILNLTNQFNNLASPNIQDTNLSNNVENNNLQNNNYVVTEETKKEDIATINDYNPIKDNDVVAKIRKGMGLGTSTSSSYIDNSNFGNDFIFIPTFNNPNSDRDDFIRTSTGYIIEEDTDNKGRLYLKVIDPAKHETIYTGKEAVRMIKNYNQAYLDANPNKTVDTTLIDNFVED